MIGMIDRWMDPEASAKADLLKTIEDPPQGAHQAAKDFLKNVKTLARLALDARAQARVRCRRFVACALLSAGAAATALLLGAPIFVTAIAVVALLASLYLAWKESKVWKRISLEEKAEPSFSFLELFNSRRYENGRFVSAEPEANEWDLQPLVQAARLRGVLDLSAFRLRIEEVQGLSGDSKSMPNTHRATLRLQEAKKLVEECQDAVKAVIPPRPAALGWDAEDPNQRPFLEYLQSQGFLEPPRIPSESPCR